MTTTAKVNDIMQIMAGLAPTALAEKWDNVGLQIGSPAWTAKRIWIALDPTPEVVRAACRDRANMLITHHPLLFRPVKAIDVTTPLGATIELALTNKLALYAAHTNYDSAAQGLNDVLAAKIGLLNSTVLVPSTPTPQSSKIVVYAPEDHVDNILAALYISPAGRIDAYDACTFRAAGTGTFRPNPQAKPFSGKIGEINQVSEYRVESVVPNNKIAQVIDAVSKAHPYEIPAIDVYPLESQLQPLGLGRIGDLSRPMELKAFGKKIKQTFSGALVKIAGAPTMMVNRVALCSGSGSGLMKAFLASDAQVYVSGDLHYHDGTEALAQGRAIIDMGHFASEVIMIESLAGQLQTRLKDAGLESRIVTCDLEIEPFEVV